MSLMRLAPTPPVLGKLLADARRELGITQADLASRIGTRQATISRLENHTSDSRVDMLYRALSALGLELTVSRIQHSPDTDW